MLEFTQRLRSTILQDLGPPVEFYQESLDLDRFSGRENSPALTRYFEDKYRGFDIDVVVPVGGRGLRFALDRLKEVLPNVPIVFALGATPQIDPSTLPAYVTGRLATASRFTPTLLMARALQPDAERIVVVGGAGRSDSTTVTVALNAIETLSDTLPLTVLQGLSLGEMLKSLRQIPRRSIVLFANFRQDAQGQVFEPLDIIGSMARASGAPMYTQLRSYVGEGVVGGSVTWFDDEGVRTGHLVARVLRHWPAEKISPVETIPNSFVADWRQLRRWGLPERRLPSETELLFREPTPWERYRTVALLTLAIISAESLLIGGLLVERRRRKLAQLLAQAQELRAEETRRQVTHMGRVALVGELAATISHDLRQPLAAIRANAEAGILLLGGASPGPSEAREIFQNIVDDDARAVEVIESVRKLLRKDELIVRSVDINEICRDAVRLLRGDALVRTTRLELSLSPNVPKIIGDPIQLEQVVLNLALNGLEAASLSNMERSVIVHTEASADYVEVLVEDSGPGIPPAVQSRLFQSFFSTKAGGLGLGLVIVRSIVERHNGRIHVENNSLGGAVFCVRLPVTQDRPTSSGAPENETTGAVSGANDVAARSAERPKLRALR